MVLFGSIWLQLRRSSRLSAEHRSHQLRVHVFDDLLQLAISKPDDEAITIVIRTAVLRGVVAARLHHHKIAFGNKAMCDCLDSALDSGAQHSQQIIQDLLLALVLAWPPGAAGHSPAEIIGHDFHQRTGIALADDFCWTVTGSTRRSGKY